MVDATFIPETAIQIFKSLILNKSIYIYLHKEINLYEQRIQFILKV